MEVIEADNVRPGTALVEHRLLLTAVGGRVRTHLPSDQRTSLDRQMLGHKRDILYLDSVSRGLWLLRPLIESFIILVLMPVRMGVRRLKHLLVHWRLWWKLLLQLLGLVMLLLVSHVRVVVLVDDGHGCGAH